MARKIKLPLDMGNDIKVRDIDELKENYNSEKVVESFLNGELLPWLRDRFYEEEAERIEALSADKDNKNIAGKLAEIFGVQIDNEVDVDEIAERNERLAKLRSITSDDEVLRNVDLVAFSQEDMDIVHESDVIYLCGEKFRIPYNVKNKRYIGVNEPLVEVKAEGNIDLESRGIVIEKCRFAEEILSKLPKKEELKENVKANDFSKADGIFGEIGRYYSPKGAKGNLSSFERLDFNNKYIYEMKIGSSAHEYKYQALELKYENMYIYISENMPILGQAFMKFNNCVIHIGSRKSSIDLCAKFNAMFSHCTFISDKCGIYDSTFSLPEDNRCLFITQNRKDNQSISFKDCLFIHSNYLVDTRDFDANKGNITVLFKSCHFINCYDNVCIRRGYNAEVSVNDCAIYQDGREMSFYNDKYVTMLNSRNDSVLGTGMITGLVASIMSLQGGGQIQTIKFIENLSNLAMFNGYCIAKDNLIMQPKNLRYLKGTVGEDWEMYGVDLDSFDLTNQQIKPTIFPEGTNEKGTLYADPSDRKALDKFFNGEHISDSKQSSNIGDKPKNISNSYQRFQPQLGGMFGFDLSEIEKMAKGIERENNSKGGF